MGSMMGKAKKLKREGAFDGMEFTEVKVIDHSINSASLTSSNAIEVVWKNKHKIKFPRVDDLIYFLKSVDQIQINQSSDITDEEAA